MLRTAFRWRNLRRRNAEELHLFAEAMCRLSLMQLRIAILVWIGRTRPYERAQPPEPGQIANAAIRLTAAQTRTAKRTGWAVERAATVLPFAVICLPQALAAREILRRRGIYSVMFFGVDANSPMPDVGTHAWLTSGETPVVGVQQAAGYRVFASFPPQS